MLAKFNETMEPLYMLLKEIEDIRLTAELLDPDIDSRIEQSNNNYDGSFSTGKWSDKKKGLNAFGNSLNNMNNFNVKINDTNSSSLQNQTKKEQPVWMLESTISGNNNIDNSKNKISIGNVVNSATRPLIGTIELPINSELSSDQAKEVLESLLLFEKPNDPRWFKMAKYFGFHNNADNNDDGMINNIKEEYEQDELMEIDYAQHFINNLPLIKVNNCIISLMNISDEHILIMNEFERQEYIRIAQKIYSAVLDM